MEQPDITCLWEKFCSSGKIEDYLNYSHYSHYDVSEKEVTADENHKGTYTQRS